MDAELSLDRGTTLHVAALFGTVLLLLVATAALAQNYPLRSVRIIVPVSPGGALDTMARAISPRLSQSLGQPVVVDNRPGANTIIGLEACARSTPDGYTICLSNSDGISYNPHLHSKLPYDPPRDFAPVINIGYIETLFAARASFPAGSVSELLELAKSRPATIAWSSFGNGSIGHLYIEWLKSRTGAQFIHVPYKGAAPALTALLAGEVQVSLVSAGQGIPQVKAGKIKPLAVIGSRRSAQLPDVPTFQELGLELQVRSWLGLFAPAATAPEIVRRLNTEIAKILADPAFREQNLVGRAIVPVGDSPENFAEFLRADREMAAKLVKLAGVHLD